MTKGFLLACAAALAVTACDSADQPAAATENAADAAGGETLATGLGDNAKLGAAVKAAGLEATLAGPGPYTVLAPSDAAFDKLPAGAVDTLMKPESRAELTAVLTYHILPGTILAADIGKAIDAGGGKALIATMGGGTLTATREGGNVVLADAAGTKAVVTTADQQRSNGVIHQIDSVLMPSA
ncbi:MAG: fasciclin domain-containing protein [Pseudomonadota bacterium]|nr:fasciclin domain-containing protein [Pseudomonadota bacterium]